MFCARVITGCLLLSQTMSTAVFCQPLEAKRATLAPAHSAKTMEKMKAVATMEKASRLLFSPELALALYERNKLLDEFVEAAQVFFEDRTLRVRANTRAKDFELYQDKEGHAMPFRLLIPVNTARESELTGFLVKDFSPESNVSDSQDDYRDILQFLAEDPSVQTSLQAEDGEYARLLHEIYTLTQIVLETHRRVKMVNSQDLNEAITYWGRHPLSELLRYAQKHPVVDEAFFSEAVSVVAKHRQDFYRSQSANANKRIQDERTIRLLFNPSLFCAILRRTTGVMESGWDDQQITFFSSIHPSLWDSDVGQVMHVGMLAHLAIIFIRKPMRQVLRNIESAAHMMKDHTEAKRIEPWMKEIEVNMAKIRMLHDALKNPADFSSDDLQKALPIHESVLKAFTVDAPAGSGAELAPLADFVQSILDELDQHFTDLKVQLATTGFPKELKKEFKPNAGPFLMTDHARYKQQQRDPDVLRQRKKGTSPYTLHLLAIKLGQQIRAVFGEESYDESYILDHGKIILPEGVVQRFKSLVQEKRRIPRIAAQDGKGPLPESSLRDLNKRLNTISNLRQKIGQLVTEVESLSPPTASAIVCKWFKIENLPREDLDQLLLSLSERTLKNVFLSMAQDDPDTLHTLLKRTGIQLSMDARIRVQKILYANMQDFIGMDQDKQMWQRFMQRFDAVTQNSLPAVPMEQDLDSSPTSAVLWSSL